VAEVLKRIRSSSKIHSSSKMQRHVENGQNWAEDEEKKVAEAYRAKTPLGQLMAEFPTDRNKKSIRMKLKNHQWQDTGKGLREGNAWVKAHWAGREEERALERREEELRDREREIEKERDRIQRRREEIEAERVKASPELTADEEMWLRDELTVVGNILCGDNVLFGGLNLLDEEPDEMNTEGYFGETHSKKFSISVKVDVTTEFTAGLCVRVDVKTKLPKIEAIVREMFESTDNGKDVGRRNWPVDWDYYYRVILRKPYVRKD
jgi:hypothetical protein